MLQQNQTNSWPIFPAVCICESLPLTLISVNTLHLYCTYVYASQVQAMLSPFITAYFSHYSDILLYVLFCRLAQFLSSDATAFLPVVCHLILEFILYQVKKTIRSFESTGNSANSDKLLRSKLLSEESFLVNPEVQQSQTGNAIKTCKTLIAKLLAWKILIDA